MRCKGRSPGLMTGRTSRLDGAAGRCNAGEPFLYALGVFDGGRCAGPGARAVVPGSNGGERRVGVGMSWFENVEDGGRRRRAVDRRRKSRLAFVDLSPEFLIRACNQAGAAHVVGKGHQARGA